MTHAHTPGPWTLINGSTIGLVIKDSAGHTVLSESQGLRNKEHAALIAAAPELLEALTNLLKMVEDGDYTTIELNEARQAIASATQHTKE